MQFQSVSPIHNRRAPLLSEACWSRSPLGQSAAATVVSFCLLNPSFPFRCGPEKQLLSSSRHICAHSQNLLFLFIYLLPLAITICPLSFTGGLPITQHPGCAIIVPPLILNNCILCKSDSGAGIVLGNLNLNLELWHMPQCLR
jgi:hypothetical protein